MVNPPGRRRYQNPPLAEAVIEFQFRAGTPWDSIYFGKIHDRLDGFPEIETIHTASLLIESERVGLGPSAESKRFWREDRGMAVTVGEGLLAVSTVPANMPEGHSWELLRDTAFAMMRTFLEVCRPGPVRQGGLRYINVLPIDPRGFRVGDYVTNTGVIPESLIEETNPFSFRLERTAEVSPEYHRREVVTLAAHPSSDTAGVLMLDVDEGVIWSPEADTSGMPGVFEIMHDAVHAVFNQVIRPEVLDSFGPVSS